MSENILRECPFCGKMPRAFGVVEKVQCINEDCSNAYSRPLTLEAWNMRPIEGALQMRISELEEAQRWIPVEERLPEDDGTLNPEDCCFVFDGNSNEISRCSFVCRFLFDEMEMKNIVIYNFIEQQWELWFDNEMIDIQVTHWLTLPDGSK